MSYADRPWEVGGGVTKTFYEKGTRLDRPKHQPGLLPPSSADI